MEPVWHPLSALPELTSDLDAQLADVEHMTEMPGFCCNLSGRSTPCGGSLGVRVARLRCQGFKLLDEGTAVNWTHLSLANHLNDFDALKSRVSRVEVLEAEGLAHLAL